MAPYNKFIRIEAWARKGPHQKNSKRKKASADGVYGELIRRPDCCPHVKEPKTPEIIFGDPGEVWDEAYAQADQAVDSAGDKLKVTALIIIAGVVTYPVARTVVEADQSERAKCEHWWEKTETWLHKEFRLRLKLIVGHWDEEYPNWHWAAVPTLGPDRRIRIGDVHPGHRAEQECRDAGGTRPEQKQAHQQAMTLFQDRYYEDVAVHFGFARFGPRRQRLTRSQWMAQTKQLRALASSHEKARQYARDLKAAADRHVAARIAEVHRSAEAYSVQIEATAGRKVADVKQRAVTKIKDMDARNRDLTAQLQRSSQIVSEQEEQLRAMDALLEEHGIDRARRR
jgi:hypothetical protein